MKKVIAIVCLLFACQETVIAQKSSADSVKLLQGVFVTTDRYNNFALGTKIEPIDSLSLVIFKHQSLADLLGSQSQLFIKSFGPGSLASSSFRGSGAEHTAVLWNGFNIQNPMNGQVDLSLLQADLTDEIKVQYGSNGALSGSGAIGGMIQLSNKPKFGSGIHTSINYQNGSFENNKESVTLSYGTAKFYTNLRLVNQTAVNDFPFTNTFLQGAPAVKQTNASFSQQALMSDNYLVLSSNQQISFSAWYQNAMRQNPPSMSVNEKKSTQNDETIRVSGEWNIHRNNHSLFVRTALFSDRLVYEDSLSGLLSNSISRTSISEVEYRSTLSKNQQLIIGINHTYIVAEADNYSGTFSQNRTSFFTSYKLFNSTKTFLTNASIREEVVAGNFLPIMPSVGFEWMLNKQIKVFGNVNRAYRIPTFNDLYWSDAYAKGNKNLQAENAWAEELSIKHTHTYSSMKVDLTATVFNRVLTNYIQWLPVNNYYTPQNVKEVWSRGLEGELKLFLPIGQCSFLYSGRINFVLSTKEQTADVNDATLHKQLMYVPRLNYMNQLSVMYKQFFVSFNQTYTGIRFTENDESNYLMYYLIGNFSIGKEFYFKNIRLSVNAQVKNIWNESYQVTQNMPMPGRNYLFGITIKI